MRKSSLLDALFPAVRREVLATTLMFPQRWWYLSDLASHLGRSPSSLQRELTQLARAGILETQQDGNRVYYRPNVDCPILPELTGIVVKTVGLVDVLRRALNPYAGQIGWAFVYGSLARGEEISSSDVDLMVIGDVTLSQVASDLKSAERRLGRPVNAAIYPRREFASKLSAGQHFVRTVAAGNKLFVVGSPREFENAFASETVASTSNKPQRA